MKNYPVLTLPDGRKVIIDAEMEIKEGDYCIDITEEKPEIRISSVNLQYKYDKGTMGKAFEDRIKKIIYSIGFSLPNVEEIETISESEELAYRLYPKEEILITDSEKDKSKKESYEFAANPLRGSFIKGYKAANKNFTEEDLINAMNEVFKIMAKDTCIDFKKFKDEYIQSLTRPDISEVFIETLGCRYSKCDCATGNECFETNITAKDSSGKEIKIRIKK